MLPAAFQKRFHPYFTSVFYTPALITLPQTDWSTRLVHPPSFPPNLAEVEKFCKEAWENLLKDRCSGLQAPPWRSLEGEPSSGVQLSGSLPPWRVMVCRAQR